MNGTCLVQFSTLMQAVQTCTMLCVCVYMCVCACVCARTLCEYYTLLKVCPVCPDQMPVR